MKRTVKPIEKNVDAIFVGDPHLREDKPVCRTDDFESHQWEVVDFIAALQKKYDCPVLCSGDLFNHWKPSPSLLSKTMMHLPENFYTIYGNHDLPQHNLELKHKSGVHTLYTAERIGLLSHTHWGKIPPNDFGFPSFKIKGRKILVWHTMTWHKELPWPGCTDPAGIRLLKKYKQYDVILTGHNHKAFVIKQDDRLLVNPGSITRQKADQINFKPRVYLYDATANSVERVYLPVKEGVISREHIDRIKQRDDRIDAFISSLDTDFKETVSFEKNLEQLIQKNKIKTSIKEIIYKALDT